MYICIEEWSATNGWQASPADQTATGNTSGSPTTSTTILSGTTATTTQAEELWIASLAYKNSAQSETGITSGWTKDLEATLASNNTMTMLYRVVSATGAASCQYTISSAQHWAGCVATFMSVVGTQTSKDVVIRGRVSQQVGKDVTMRGNIYTGVATKDIVMRGLIGTPLVLYGSNVSDAALPTASSMSQVTGGTETSATTTATGVAVWVEVLSRSATIATVSAIGSPSDKGWVFSPGAGTFQTGNWSVTLTLSASSPGTTDVTVRFYKLSGGVHTLIGSINKTGITGTKTTYTFTPTSFSSMTFAAGDLLVRDVWWHDTSGADDNPVIYESNSAAQGVVSDVVTTSVFIPAGTQTNKDIVMRGLINQLVSKDVVMRGLVNQLTVKDITMRANVGTPPVLKDITVRGRISQQIQKDIALRGHVSQQTIKDILMRGKPADTHTKDIALRGRVSTGVVKDVILRGHVSSGNVAKDVILRGRVSQLATGRDIVMRGKISGPRIASGGFTLFANGTGTVSFSSAFRATQYPDPALSLAPVLDRLGSSSASWNAVTPAGTTAGIKTSTDGINFTTATNGASIPGLTGQPDPIIDIFDGDGTATYTNTCKSGGSVATVTLDTANKRLTLSGGSGALYLNSSVNDDDIDIICDMDRSDAGGPAWRVVDNQNYYELGCYDDSASGGFTNQLRLYKVLAGTRTLLGTASSVTWYRSTPGTSPYKRIRVTMLAGTITVYFDGAQMQTYTDASPLAAGKVGLRNDAGTSRYYQLRVQQFGDYVSGTPAGDIVTGKFIYTEQDLATTDPSTGPQVLDVTTSARSPKIATGALIPALHDPTRPFAEYFNKEMDTIAQASGDVHWNVDKVGELSLNERDATPAPFCIHSSDLLFTPNVQPTNASDLYRNQMIITNTIGITDVVHEEKVSDGSATSWNMAYPLYSAPEIVVGGVVKTVGVQGTDTGRDFYWQAGSPSIGQDESADKLPAGYILEFDYIGQYPDQVTRNNLPEQAAQAAKDRANGRPNASGIVCVIEDGKGMLSSNAIVYADGKLARHNKNDTVEIIATTERPGLVTGMVAPHFIDEHHLQNRQLLITKVTRTGYMQSDGTTTYRYAYTATDGPNMSNWSESLFG
jgi:hypothetical protein